MLPANSPCLTLTSLVCACHFTELQFPPPENETAVNIILTDILRTEGLIHSQAQIRQKTKNIICNTGITSAASWPPTQDLLSPCSSSTSVMLLCSMLICVGLTPLLPGSFLSQHLLHLMHWHFMPVSPEEPEAKCYTHRH